MRKSTAKKLMSMAVTVPISIVLAAVCQLILVHLFDFPLGWVDIALTGIALCAVYWFAVMKWQRSEALPLMRYARMLISTLIQMIFLAIAGKAYFRSHSIDIYAPYTAVARCWFLIAPLALNILTNLTFRQLHRLRVRLKSFRLYMKMIKNQINKGRK